MAKLGTVVAITGSAFVQNESGQRALKLGDTIQPGDTIITARGVTVELEMVGNKEHVIITGDQVARMTDEVGNIIQADVADSAIDQATIDAVMQAIEQGKDINEALEETAAGLTGGAGNAYGFSFVDLLRVIESFDPFHFQLQEASGVHNDFSSFQESNDGSLVQNRVVTDTPAGHPNHAPSAVAAAFGGAEDSSIITGSLATMATDSDGDPMTFSVIGATPPGMIVNPNGSYSFDYSDSAYQHLKQGEVEVINVTWQVSDGKGGTDTAVLQITVTGTNDAPIITGISTASLTETNVIQSTGGTLAVTDADAGEAVFTPQTGVAGNNGYGTFSIDAAGVWTYTMDSAHNEFVGGTSYTDSITVTTADGTTQVITVTMTGTDDATVISGTSTATLTESNAVQSTGGTLTATDPDSSADFTPQTGVAGNNGYGTFSIDAAGVWTYTMDSAHNEFVGGTSYTDSITVTTADGTTQVITVTMTGTDDATVISGTSTATLTESNAVQSTGGTLTATDPDSSADFTPQTGVAGNNGYGTFSIDAAGVWTYTMDSAHNEFVGGTSYTDSITVTTADGTTQVITVTMTGTDDATVISGTSTATLTESNAVQSTGGTLTATDPDSSADFTPQTGVAGNNGYGTFSIDAAGVWTYTMDSAHNEFVGGTSYTDSITVTTADGTTQVITVTMTGTNDAAVITGTVTGSVTEDLTLTSTGTLSITDADTGEAGFQPQTSVATTYGNFTIDAAGVWTYNLNNSDPAVQTLANGQTLNDSITVFSIDGTPTTVIITINGSDETATIGVGAVEEDVTLASTGTLVATGAATFVPDTASGTYGDFTVDAAGVWSYTLNNASPAVQGLAQGETHSENFIVTLSDGSTTSVNITVSGTDDATVISGTSTATLTESNAVQSTGGTLTATDPDSSADFTPQTGVAGNNGYGTFSIDAAGVWTYTMDSAHNEFVGGTSYTDSITVTTADGTTQVITVTMTGTDDATVISGTSTATLTESNAVQSTGGTLTATDPDSSADFTPQTGVAGNNGYGTFSIDAAGVWTYTMDSAHNEFVGGTSYTDSITVTTADGTTQVITVTMTGTDDATVISGTSTATLTESNAVQSTGGTLTATDPDSSADFTPQTGVAGNNGYGTFSIDAAGVWTYTMDSAHNEFVGGTSYTDSITVTTADGTTQVITVTMTGTDDATVISGTSTATLTESNAVQSTGGTLTATDPDSSADFTPQTGVAGNNGYGTFSIDAAGVWTYTMDSAHNEFVGGTSYTDSITVTTADGTTQVITVTMTGTDDAAIITGTVTGSVTEDVSSTSTGTLSITDADTGEAGFQPQTSVATTYGNFTIDAAGVWTYNLNNSDPAVQTLANGQTLNDSITVFSIDGTPTTVIITINGSDETATIGVGAVEEDVTLASTGTLIASGVATFVPATVPSTYGSFSVAANGDWTYTLNNASPAVQGLAQGETHSENFIVTLSDGSTTTVNITVTGTNDAAVISGTTTGSVTEAGGVANAIAGTPTATGTLTDTDVDNPANTFTATGSTASTNGYGTYTMTAGGVWTYTLNNSNASVQALNTGGTLTDTFTVTSVDGTPRVITVTIGGTNDAAVITGTSTASLTETNAVQSTGGTLSATDVDSATTFVAQTSVAGTNGYGTFSINAAGVWTYTMDSAHNEFAAGSNYTDSITVATADGTTQVITVTMAGTNDAAVISGTSTATITETNAVQSAGGTLTATDVDSAATFVAQTSVAGSNGYGTFSINAAGVWTYTMNTAHNEFVGGSNYTDSITVATADGTTQVITVTMTGTNDAAVISGTSTASLTETNAIQSTGGTLTATDVDSAATFVAQTGVAGSNGYGSFTINAAGVWTYTMSTAHNEFVAGTNYTDSITVATADGTTQVITVTIAGTNDAAVISGTTTGSVTEAGGVANAIAGTPTATGTLTDTDVDNPANTFTATGSTASTNGYGTYTMTAGGVWTYTLNNSNASVQALNTGGTLTDTFTVTSVDGTPRVITVTIGGTNDAAVITGTSTASLTETNAVQSTGGTLSATDVDSATTFVAQTSVAGTNGYGTFSINAAGVWTYTMNTAHNEFAAGTNYTDSITVATADGTTQVITVTMAGTNDAAVISGTSTATITETNAVQSAGGTLTATDVDSAATFVAQTSVAGSNGYGTFSINAAGVWTYTMNTAHNEFVGGSNYTDSITVATADGTTQVITVTMTGTNDAAVISGTSTASLTETNAIQSTGGTLTATDVDSAATFVAQTGVAGSNGYGSFTINAAGVWTYTMSTAHNEFVAGTNYTDSITVATADGTTQVITVTIAGTNDAAVISGTTTGSVTEAGGVANAIAGTPTATGTLTDTDVDNPANTFTATGSTASTNGYGTYTMTAGGVWTYTLNNSNASVQALNTGGTLTDTFTVTSVDGTPRVITVTIGGTNDAAVITGTSTASLTETNAVQSTGGTLSATDVDSATTFVAQTSVAGTNGYGTFSINAAGVWTYTMNTAHNEFAAGTNYTDSITVATADGTTQVITVTMAGTNDAAVISGTSTATITETNAVQSAGGTLTATDVDSAATFVAQTSVAGSNGYGTFSINAAGVWTYTMNTAHNEFVGGSNYTDSITVATADGTTQVITVTMTGTNDAAVISGTSTASLTETNAIQSTGGTLTATDVDSAATFVAQTGVAGSNGYGSFTINAAGVWTYTMSTAHNEFVAGTNYTDSITVATADGTTQVITVTIAGTNDAAVISGTTTGSVTEAGGVANAIAGTPTATGTLTDTDVDNPANTFTATGSTASTNGYGTYTMTAGGVWTYTLNNSNASVQALNTGGTLTDTFTVTSVDGTPRVITVTIGGTNDAAVITGTSTASLTETNAVQSTGGTLSATDVDSATTFVAQTSVAGTNGYGTFSINAAGVWTYTMNTAHNEFAAGSNYTDSITVATADGTTQVITVTMAGTNDAAVISGTSTATITETNAVQSAGGTLTATDVDSAATFVAQTSVAGSNGYGTFSINAAGVWTYTMNTAHNEFVGGSNYTDSITVATADGTTQVITVTMTGTNDAAVISGTSTASLTETNAIQSTGGTLTATDVDSAATFVAQTGVAGSNGYGSFTINAAGVWTYTMSTAHNEFVAGTNYTDSITVATADGTTQVITVTIAGTNDAAVISGTTTGSVTEAGGVANAIAGTPTATGTLTDTDVDNPANTFTATGSTASTNGYGTYTMTAGGVWTYTLNNSNASVQALNTGGTLTDTFTVTSVDGTPRVITVTIGGTNDAAVITGTSTASLTETNAVQSTGGTLSATDVDSATTFVAQTSVAGTNGYGTFSINAAGVWTYTMDSAHNEFAAGSNYTDSITVATADGTTQVITVTMAGTNDAAVISGTSTATITETNAVQSAGGTLTATDVDSAATFVAQTSVAGSNGYGTFSINAAGVWTYTMNTAHNEFVGGSNYTDSITVATADGTTQVITVTMTGTNDAAVISGTSTASLTETNAIQSTGGTLTATDVDSAATFVAQTGVAGSNGYGSFTINAAGVWTYTMSTAHNEFVAGTNYTDSITVATADGTTQVITVTIAGTNDAAVISGTTTGSVTEAGGVANAIAGTPTATGTLTDTDVDNPANTFTATGSTASTNGYGTYTMTAGGVWTYTLNNSNASVQALNTGGTLTDTFTVTSVDGTPRVITVTIGGTNDAAVITGTSTASLTETNAVQSTGGTLSATDVDSATTFVAQTSVAGTNGYGTFSINAAGVWTYTMNTAHNEFAAGSNYTDSITVATADGTTQVITVTMAGTNDAAVISGTSTATITETNAVQSAGGTLTATDVDSAATFVAQTSVAGSNGYGTFSINAAGVWTYTMNTAHNEFVGGSNYTDSITVATADGTTQVITVTMTGTNDAAVISGTSTASLTETNAIQSTGGTLTATDVDSAATFVAQTGVAGSNGYGSFTINAAGVWTYTMSTAHNEFVAGTNYTDSITVATADGTTQVITVTIAGTNDAAVISGTTTGSVTEAGGVANAIAGTPTATGTLTDTDVDNPANTFTATGSTASTNGYGTYTMTAGGVWTYTLNNSNASVQALNTGGTLTDTFTVTSVDGTPRVITVTIGGTNDAAVITGTSTASLTETNAVQSTGGTLSATDVDSATTFVAQTSVAGTNGYGTFSINAAGVWTYTMNTAHNEFAAGTNYTDSITVATADGTTQVITVTMAGTNDAAVISGTSTATITETNAVQSAGGTLTATDVDSAATFVAQTSVAGSNGYGTFSINAAGVWTYTMNTAHNEFVGGSNYTDSITVATADGTTQVITVTMTGTNDAAVISGTSTASLTETNAIQSTGGTLTATDVDSAATFVAQTGVAGSNGYGSFTINAAGVWTYTMSTAHNEFVAGTNYTDSITVATADGTTQVITVTIAGTNDAAVISGTTTGSVTEAGGVANAIAGTPTATGTLTDTDVDNPANTFTATGSTASTNGYGTYTMTAGGVWTYTLNNSNASVQALNTGGTLTDTFTVTSVDGTPRVITVTIGGTNDAAVITGTSTASLTETNAVQSTGGTLSATDVDSATTFVAQTSVAGTNGYGTFSINAAGVWTYTMNTAHNEFAAGTNYTDSITVATADGTTQVITVTMAGTNDAAVISGTSTATITETNAVQSAGGTLTATDVDSAATFVAQTSVAGSNGYGTFSINAAGVWTYTMNTAHNEFVGGSNYTDSITVATADGTTQVITVTMTGTNDAAVISGTSTASLTETNAIQSTGGTLTATDVDSAATFVAQTGVAGSNGYGSFTINAAGVWTYTMSTAHNEFVAGTNYTDSITVATADGTTQVITVTIAGTNDAAVISGTTTGSVTEAGGVANAIAGTPTATGTLTDTDVDNPANTFTATGSTASTNGYGTYTMTAGGVWTYTLNNSNASVQALNTGGTLTDTFTVTSVDGTPRVITVTIGGTNDAAVISGTSTGSVTEASGVNNAIAGTPTVNGTLTDTDVDNPANTFTAVAAGTASTGGYGTYQMTAAGVWTYTLNNSNASVQALNVGQTLTDTFTVTSVDGTAKVVTVTINGANDAPVVVADTKTILEDSGATAGNVLTNDSDLEGGALSVTQFVVNSTTYTAGTTANIAGVGSLVINANGSYTFTPVANYSGSVPTATYTVSDGSATNTSTLNVTVTPVADAPTLVVNGGSTTGGTITVITGSAPAVSGLTQVYSAAGTNAVTTANAANLATFETAIESSTATSTTTVTSIDVLQANAPTDSAFRFNGFIYLTAGNSYTISGYRDDTLLIKFGGTQVYGSAHDTYGNFTATSFTPTTSGFYSLEVDYYNGSGVGSLDVNVSVNGAAAVDLNTTNFSLYADSAAVAATGAPFTPNNDGGYYTYTVTNSAEDSSIPIGTIGASLNDPSESLAVTISTIPVGATLTDGTNTFTATLGNTSANVTAWNLNNISITPPANFNGVIDLTVTATSTDAGGTPATASSVATLEILVSSVNDAPSGTNQTINIVEDQGYTLSASNFGFTDTADGDALLAVRITTTPTGGALYLNNVAVTAGTYISAADIAAGRLTYVPTANSTTNRSFTFQVQDSGGTANGGVDLDPTANTITFNISADANDYTGGQTLALNVGNVSVADNAGTDTIILTTTGAPTFSTFEFNRYATNMEFIGISGASTAHITMIGQYGNDVELMQFSAGGTYLGYSLGNTAYNLNTDGSGVNSANDIVVGSSANDVLSGGTGTGQDIIFGGAGNDSITASGSGAHLLVGGVGDDTITGGTGADTYVFGMADGTDTITDAGGAGDSIAFDANGAVITGLSFTDSSTTGGAGNLVITYNDQQITVTNHFNGTSNIESLTFFGGATYAGYSLSGPYTLSTDDAGARTSTAGVNTILVGSSANDTITGNSGNDLLFGGDGNDVISSGTGTNLLVGGAGNDTMTGGTGADWFVGGSGNDSMTGGVGADVFKWELADKGTVGTPAADTISDFGTAIPTSGGDVLDLRDLLVGENTGNLTNYLYFEKSGSDTIVHISSAGSIAGTDTLSQVNSKNDQTITLQNVDLVTPFGGDQANIIADLVSKQKLVTD